MKPNHWYSARSRPAAWCGPLWPSRPRDEVHFELTHAGSETLLRFTLLTPDELPDESKVGYLRRRLSQLLFGDLRLSYGQ